MAVLSHTATQFTAPDTRRQLPEGCTDTGPHLRINLLELIHLSPYTELHGCIRGKAACSTGREELAGEGQDPPKPPSLPEKL